MSLLRKRTRRGTSITSLIDVIFLLLLFFMLASTFTKQAEIEFVSGTEGASESEAPQVIRLMVLAESLQIDGNVISEPALPERLGQELSDANSVVALEMADEVSTQRIIDVLLLLRDLSEARIHIVVPS